SRTLFCALVNPGPNQTHLLGCERLWGRPKPARSTRTAASTTGPARSPGRRPSRRRITTRSPRRPIARSARAATWTTAGATRTTGFKLRRHSLFLVQPSHSDDQRTLGAFAGNDNRTVFAAFQRRFKGVQAQPALVTFLIVATETGGLENWLDVFGVS